MVLPHRRLKARQRALKRASNDDKSSEASAIRLSQKVNFALSQVIDHELRLFREIDQLRQKATENAVNVMKALKYIDKKQKDGLDKR